MPETYSRKQLFHTHTQIVQVLDELVRKNFSEWSQSLDGEYLKRLEQPLLVRSKDKTAKLDINFDRWVSQTLMFPFIQSLTQLCPLYSCDTYNFIHNT